MMRNRSCSVQVDSTDTVGDVLERIPGAMELFQNYQAGTPGVCVITREDTLEDLSERFGVSLKIVLNELNELRLLKESSEIS